MKARKILTAILPLLMAATLTTPTFAADYTFGTGSDTMNGFGTSTSTDRNVKRDPLTENTRRNKDAADTPPPYGIFSGDIPTEPSSPYHDNSPTGGFISVDQNLPAVGNEDYSPGSSKVSTKIETPSSFLPSTSQADTLNTTPWYYEDGSIGTLYVSTTKKTIKVYEGEDLANLKIGAGHFSSTSTWDGNVALAGHNRGSSGYFSFVKDLKKGDVLKYTTKYGTRSYKVISKTQINENDTLSLSWSDENILTLITCVADVPEARFCVVAKMVS